MPKDNEVDSDLKKIMDIPDDQELPDEYKVDVMIRALESHQINLRSIAVNQLVELGKRIPDIALPKIISALNPEVDYWSVRFGAAEALGEIASKSTVNSFISYLNDEDPDFRAKIAEQLGVMGEIAKPAGKALIEVLNDKESIETREFTAKALGQIKVQEAVIPLIEQLKIEKEEYVKREIAWSLGELENKTAEKILIKKLSDFDVKTRGNAAEALGKIKSEDSILSLLKSSEDESTDVQHKAIWALEQYDSNSIIKCFKEASDGDVFKEIEFLDKFVFNLSNETISQYLVELRQPILEQHKEELTSIKNNLLENQQIVNEIFTSIKKLNVKKAKKLLSDQVPKYESIIANTSFYKYRKHKWLSNANFFELDEATKVHRETGEMLAELREAISKFIKEPVVEENIEELEDSQEDE